MACSSCFEVPSRISGNSPLELFSKCSIKTLPVCRLWYPSCRKSTHAALVSVVVAGNPKASRGANGSPWLADAIHWPEDEVPLEMNRAEKCCFRNRAFLQFSRQRERNAVLWLWRLICAFFVLCLRERTRG